MDFAFLSQTEPEPDPEPEPMQETTDEDGDDGEGGVSSAITIRLQRARILALEAQVKQLQNALAQQAGAAEGAGHELKEAVEERGRLIRVNKQLEAQFSKINTQYELLKAKNAETEAQFNGLKKEFDQLQKENKSVAAQGGAKQTKMNRALEEEIVGKARTQEDAFRAELKNYQRQKTELILAFKKQQKLIDVLKRQKMHIEASRLFNFTEEEFTKLLDQVERTT
ncbi:MAG: hypothetical protein EZS28_021452 [Streblomastix strix]|uniref:Uncharacterized protein n=1 Tax=Streblomastix strix TaxID=222440 RepID=A0A5J4VKB3_9EUKA|nr:MAG: hypothetical protein EZS28_021452 [Streblomastix strix]